MRYIKLKYFFPPLLLLLIPFYSFAGTNHIPSIAGIRLEFILFALILLAVAVFYKKTFLVSVIGLAVMLTFKLIFDPAFHVGEHFLGNAPIYDQLVNKDLRQGEWPILVNLFGLLLGFAVLAKLFEESGVSDYLPKFLPDDWKGPFVLLIFIFILSTFLDNIAAALIGGTIAMVVFNRKVHLGYIVAIVAASNAGGSGSVLGDTTTTMMWIDGVSPFDVLRGFIAAGFAFFIFGWIASKQQDKYHRIQKDPREGVKIKYSKLFIVILMLIGAIVTNFLFDMPALGVWIALLIGATFSKTPWDEIPAAMKGTIFLLCLTTCASLIPVNELPPASWSSAFIIGFISAVFNNIPLTKLCLEQGCYDWGMLAYTIGFGGSIIWFGSSAGVAICNMFPEGRNAGQWLKKGWHVSLAYVAGFFFLFLVAGWHPADNKKIKVKDCPCKESPAKTDTPRIKINITPTSK